MLLLVWASQFVLKSRPSKSPNLTCQTAIDVASLIYFPVMFLARGCPHPTGDVPVYGDSVKISRCRFCGGCRMQPAKFRVVCGEEFMILSPRSRGFQHLVRKSLSDDMECALNIICGKRLSLWIFERSLQGGITHAPTIWGKLKDIIYLVPLAASAPTSAPHLVPGADIRRI